MEYDIPASTWKKYYTTLSSISEKAADKMLEYIRVHGSKVNQEFIDYAYALSTHYGEAAGELASKMYEFCEEYYWIIGIGDEAPYNSIHFEPAEPAGIATYGEVAKAMKGIGKTSSNPNSFANAVGRMVKQAAEDTTLKNAARDGAEFAWVPNGDTCAFCIMLASNGWQRMSKKAQRGIHAEHIHSNCDCTYAVRFNGKGGPPGYDPDKYLEIYENAEGNTWQEKLNSMRRESYAENADKIREQKRAAYAEKIRKGKLPNISLEDFGLTFVDSEKPIIPSDHIMAGKGCKSGRKIDDIDRLVKEYSELNANEEGWSKRKMRYLAEDEYGQVHEIEIHYYQHPNVGKCEDKIKFDDSGNPFAEEWER